MFGCLSIGRGEDYQFHLDGTTASTTAFALWELAKDLDLQHRIRQEISHTLHRVKEQGETEIKFDDYEGMPLLVAFIKASCTSVYEPVPHTNKISGGLEVSSGRYDLR